MSARDSAEKLVKDALEQVDHGAPAAYAAMAKSIGRRVIGMSIGNERFLVAVNPGSSAEAPDVEITAGAVVLRDVVSGDEDLYSAIMRGAIDIVGAPDALVSASEAATFFMTGLLRCFSAETLLARLDRLAEREEGRA